MLLSLFGSRSSTETQGFGITYLPGLTIFWSRWRTRAWSAPPTWGALVGKTLHLRPLVKRRNMMPSKPRFCRNFTTDYSRYRIIIILLLNWWLKATLLWLLLVRTKDTRPPKFTLDALDQLQVKLSLAKEQGLLDRLLLRFLAYADTKRGLSNCWKLAVWKIPRKHWKLRRKP